MNPIEMILDENNTDNIILYNEDGEAVEFEQIALVPLDGETFVLLRPLIEGEDIAEDEALVFAIENMDDEDVLVTVDDEEVIDAVFEEYYDMLRAEGVDVD